MTDSKPPDIDARGYRPLGALLVALTLLTSFVPIWLNAYASIWLVPGYVGWIVLLIALPGVWNNRRSGSYLAIAGSVLLLLPGLSLLFWGSFFWMRQSLFFWDFQNVVVVLAFLFAIMTTLLPVNRLFRAKPPRPHECPRCKYDRTGIAADAKCPECGECGAMPTGA